jgi:exodeoxyribonuclease VII small subunit
MATDDAPTADPDELGYARALAELEEILDALEDDTVDVDRLATQVQRAAELIRICRGRIRDARVDVEQIVADLEEA